MLQYSSMIFFTLKFSYLLPHLSLFFRLLLLIHVLGEAVERSETDERDGIGLCPVLTEAVRTLSRSPHPPPSGAPSPRGRLRAAEGGGPYEGRRGTPQGSFSRPSADSPSAPALHGAISWYLTIRQAQEWARRVVAPHADSPSLKKYITPNCISYLHSPLFTLHSSHGSLWGCHPSTRGPSWPMVLGVHTATTSMVSP